MGFELHQPPSRIEAVNEFTDRMKDTLEEAKSALAKAKDNMARYYNCCHSPTLSFSSSDMVYLDSEDIQTTRLSKKLSHHHLGVRATAVGRDAERNAVLAGDPKKIRLLCNTTLITDIPSRGSKEERIRIHLQVWANIQNNGYKR